MTTYDVVKKLIGPINPVGETQTDELRFKNLELMTLLVYNLVFDIDQVYYENKNSQAFSVKRSADFANKFLKNDLGIKV